MYTRLHYKLYFWRNYDGAEVDVLCETKNGFVAIATKASATWQRRFQRGLNLVRKALGPAQVKTYGVYPQGRRARIGDHLILPADEFLARLWCGDVI